MIGQKCGESLLAYPRGFHFSSILSFFCILLPKNKGSSFLEIYPKSNGFSHFLIALLNSETQKMVFFFFWRYTQNLGNLATFSWCSSFLILNNGVLLFWRYTQNPRVVAIFLLLFLILRPNKMVFFFFGDIPKRILATFSGCSSFLIPNNGVLHFLKVWQILSLLITLFVFG